MKEESEIYPTVLSINYERNVFGSKRLFTEMRSQIGLDEDLFFSYQLLYGVDQLALTEQLIYDCSIRVVRICEALGEHKHTHA